MYPATKAEQSKGVAVAVVMLMVLMIIAMTVASGLLTSQNYSTGSFREKMLHADLAVKAGISTAMAKLTEDPSWAPTETSPYKEFLNSRESVGFQVWLEANNESGTTPIPASDGTHLQPGQAALRVQALINGETVTGGFGGADRMIILERPMVEFDHAIFRITQGELTINSNDGQILSYNSSTGVLPFQSFPDTPPSPNQKASIRSLGDINLSRTVVHGEAVLPSHSNLGTYNGGTALLENRLDEGYLPRVFESQGRLPGTITGGLIPPGEYDQVNVPDGGTVSFQRGETYYFSNLVDFGDDVTVELSGPASDGPVVIFGHTLYVGKNCRINMPAAGVAPVPGDFQFYGVPQPGCTRVLADFGANAVVAMVMSSQIMDTQFAENVTFYGAVNTNGIKIADNLRFHYDEALRGQPFPARTEWVMVSHGLR
ncbi:MAG: hypothetical protein WC423_22350 [Vulcanimicrobiota bacterium]